MWENTKSLPQQRSVFRRLSKKMTEIVLFSRKTVQET
jgi:hypothetical protein